MGNENGAIQENYNLLKSHRNQIQIHQGLTAQGISTNQKTPNSLDSSMSIQRHQPKQVGPQSFEKQRGNWNRNDLHFDNNKNNSNFIEEPMRYQNRSAVQNKANQKNVQNFANKQRIESLRAKEKVYLGDKIELVCLFQAAEIERLSMNAQQYQAIFFEIQKRNKDLGLNDYLKDVESRLMLGGEKAKSISSKDDKSSQNNRIEPAARYEQLKHKESNQNWHNKKSQAQFKELKIKYNKLSIQNDQLKEKLQKEAKQKTKLQSKLAEIQALLQKTNYADSEKFAQYQQIISKKDHQIKKIRKRLKERNLEIRTLNYELQQSQTNQCDAYQENEQLIFQLSKLNLREESVRLKSELVSYYLKKSTLSKKSKQQQQQLKGSGNMLMVPPSIMQFNQMSSRLRPNSRRRNSNDSQNSAQKNSFLQVIEGFSHKSRSSMRLNPKSFKIQHRYSDQDQIVDEPYQKLNQSQKVKHFVDSLKIDLKQSST